MDLKVGDVVIVVRADHRLYGRYARVIGFGPIFFKEVFITPIEEKNPGTNHHWEYPSRLLKAKHLDLLGDFLV